jgi:potassium-transporting ATPase KdpC subunit
MKNLICAVRMYVLLTIVCGVLYTLTVTAIAQCLFPYRANGSLVMIGGKIVGSELLGQDFEKPEYFRGRTSSVSYDPLPSGASNLSPISFQLKDSVEARRKEFYRSFGLIPGSTVPPDMLFSSASGLDPHISPEAARLQINRIAGERHLRSLQEEALSALVERSIEQPQLGILGMPRVNVLLLNCKLDSDKQERSIVPKFHGCKAGE